LYTALVYGGLSLAAKIARDLDKLLEQDGFKNVKDAVGTDKVRWL
jgi:dihydroorotate dehydrogenase